MHSDTKKCFNDIELGSFLENKLSPEEEDAFVLRISKCKDCWDEFISITGIIAQKGTSEFGNVPDHLTEKAMAMFPAKQRIFDIVISMVKDSIELISSAADFETYTPAYAASLRGEKVEQSEMIVLKKSFDDIDVKLDIEKVAEDQCNIRVVVDDTYTKKLMNTLRADLISQGRELESNLFEDGKILLENLGKGQYIIKIHRKEKLFGEIVIKIK